MKQGIGAQSITLASLLLLGCTTASKGFESVTAFKEIPTEYVHSWDKTVHPFNGAAVIDIDNDGKMEVFVSGGQNQPDALLSYKNGRLVNIIDNSGLSNLSAGYGPTSIDIDNDGDVDLFVARQNGLFLYLNNNGAFTEKQIPLNLPKDSVPLSIALGDIDRDGDADLYISVFVAFSAFKSATFNDPEHAKLNIMLRNDGNLNFTDITKQSGTEGLNNTFLSVFTDLDHDGWQDLVVAQNTGEIEIFKNNHNNTFTAIPTRSGYGFWMGLGLGDIDNDGDQDLFFSNVGNSIPAFLTTGDIRKNQRHELEWLLLRNDGDFNFTDVTEAYGITGEGFAWGGVFEDLNLDGQLDLLVAQNYIKWPIHSLFKLDGKTYLQNNQNQFIQVDELGLDNPHYGQSPLSVDLNGDNRPDILWVNMNGPLRAFLNQSTNNVFVVRVPEQVSLLGTRVSVETTSGNLYTREVVTSTGMLTDQSPDLVFGLGANNSVNRVIIQRPDGRTIAIENPGAEYRLTP